MQIAKMFAAAGIALALVSSATAQSGDEVGLVLREYDHVLTGKDRRDTARFIYFMQSGMMWANAALKHRHQPLLYCQPAKLSITNDEMIQMLRDLVADDPKAKDYPLGMGVLIALQKSFPCN